MRSVEPIQGQGSGRDSLARCERNRIIIQQRMNSDLQPTGRRSECFVSEIKRNGEHAVNHRMGKDILGAAGLLALVSGIPQGELEIDSAVDRLPVAEQLAAISNARQPSSKMAPRINSE